MLLPEDDSRLALELSDHYVIQPTFPWWDADRARDASAGKPCPEGFRYASDTNDWWLTPEELERLVDTTHAARPALWAAAAR